MKHSFVHLAVMLAVLMFVPGSVLAATAGSNTARPPEKSTGQGRLPDYQDFARHATLHSAVLSPDGSYLAVSAHNEKLDDKGADWQLVVFKLPELKVLSRLNMAPRTLPLSVVWVSNKRLAMGVGRNTGTLEAPSSTGEIVAVDYNGGRKRILYTRHNRKRSSIRAMMRLNMPVGSSQLAGVPDQLNGHIYISITPYKSRGTATSGSWLDGDSLLFDVDAVSGRAVEIGKIYRAGMTFVLHDGAARLAVGHDDKLEQVVFVSAGKGKPWQQLPKSVTGREMTPLRISQDGKQLYSLYSEHGEPAQLVLSQLDGSNRKVLASDDFASVAAVEWSLPPERKPYAVVYTVGRPRIQYIDPDNHLAQLHQVLSKKFPDEFISFLGISRDGKKILIDARSDRDPGAVALFDAARMNLKPLYRVLPWITPQRMAKTRPIRFKSSDGMQLDGYLTLPAGGTGKNLPMVMYPHGGPIGVRDDWFYSPDSQFLASRGYAVLQVNYRGSSGRGSNFQRKGWGQFGTGIMQDQIDAVHWAIDKGYADKDRICIYGGSFGGYSALMAPIRAPGLFKCSIDYAGVSDFTIEFDRSDTRRFKGGRYYFRHAIGTDRDTVVAISPIYHLDKFDIPVLIAHGEDDPRVPIQNATELRKKLDAAGKPYEWLVKPKELHGFYSEANRAELYKTMGAFLDKYIGAGQNQVAK